MAAADSASFLVANLSKEVSNQEDVTFRVWIEGEDEHCDNDIIGGAFSVTIALYTFVN